MDAGAKRKLHTRCCLWFDSIATFTGKAPAWF